MKSRSRLAVLVILGLAIVPISAYAGHRFSDVPSGNTFHDDISWLADVGVTRGCNPPNNDEFCPDDAVTRAQMAAFMRRFYNNLVPDPTGLGFDGRSANEPPKAGNGVIVEMDLNMPSSGVLLLEANAEISNEVESDFAACGINVGGSPTVAVPNSWRAVDLSVSIAATCATSTLIQVGPGSQIARLILVEGGPNIETFGASISATFYSDFAAFGLFSETVEQTEMRPLKDEPKVAS